MPVYASGGSGSITLNTVVPQAIWPGDYVFLFGTPTVAGPPFDSSNVTGETVAAGRYSVPVAIPTAPARGEPPSVGVEFIFSATPGVFEIDIQESDTDADAAYITPSSATYQVKASLQQGTVYVARVDLSPTGGTFLRLYVKTWPNAAVTVIAKVKRQ